MAAQANENLIFVETKDMNYVESAFRTTVDNSIHARIADGAALADITAVSIAEEIAGVAAGEDHKLSTDAVAVIQEQLDQFVV